MAATPAATLSGLILKAGIVAGVYDDAGDLARWVEAAEIADEALSRSIVLDLARLAPGA